MTKNNEKYVKLIILKDGEKENIYCILLCITKNDLHL